MAYQSIRDDDVHAATVRRIQNLAPDSERCWGVMDHDQLLPHLVDGMRLALDGTDRRARGLFATSLMRSLVVHRLSWPEGKAKAPEGAFQRVCEDWDADRAELLGLIERYRATPGDQLGNAHPIFGSMKTRDWDVLMWRHLDHHLRQFSC
ncbi:MAG: DUF1569 domain-containing protein [Gemmatimonadota bacterium]|nr:DUF1569 domain-containing protein [Gemmatimonadota bacterium]